MSAVVEQVPQIYEPEYYQRLFEIEEHHWWAKGMRNAMDVLLRPRLTGNKKLRVLDAGCGTGFCMRYLRERYPVEGQVVGVDISEHALEFCRLRGENNLIHGNVAKVPLPSRSFDLIVCVDTLQHLSPAGVDQTVLFEFARLLDSEGVLYLRTNSSTGHVPIHGANADRFRRYDLGRVKVMLECAGFEVKRATHLNMLPSVAACLREYSEASSWGDDSQQAHASGPGLHIKPVKPSMSWMASILYADLRIEAALIGAGINLPFGHSTGFVAVKR